MEAVKEPSQPNRFCKSIAARHLHSVRRLYKDQPYYAILSPHLVATNLSGQPILPLWVKSLPPDDHSLNQHQANCELSFTVLWHDYRCPFSGTIPFQKALQQITIYSHGSKWPETRSNFLNGLAAISVKYCSDEPR